MAGGGRSRPAGTGACEAASAPWEDTVNLQRTHGRQYAQVARENRSGVIDWSDTAHA
jgi:hypothetical protein